MIDTAGARRRRVQLKQSRERARIIEAAKGLFFRNGYAGTTVDAIAASLGVKKPFIYWYFDNKEDLFAALCIRSAEVSTSTLVMSEQEPDALKALYESCRRVALVSIFDYEASALPFREPNALSAVSRKRMRKYAHDYSVGLARVLARAKRAKVIDCRNLRVTALVMGGIVTSLHRWYDPKGKLAPQDLAHELACAMVGAAGGPDCNALKPKRPVTRALDLAHEPWAVQYWWLTGTIADG